MNKQRIFLCGITSVGKEDNLRALIEPIKQYINGCNWTYHYPTDDGADYLETVAGEGRIVYSVFSQRHGFSMTNYLYQGTMVDGDIFIQIDDLERITPKFFEEKMPGYVRLMQETDITQIANYGKGLIYKFNEELRFEGSPHWYAVNTKGQAINEELDKQYFYNVRAEQRDPFQWVEHYAKYHLYPAGSNSALLGLEKQGDPQKLFPIVEKKRLEFRKLMRERKYALNIAGLTNLLKNGMVDPVVKKYVNESKVLCDFYNYTVLGLRNMVDTHRLEDMTKVE